MVQGKKQLNSKPKFAEVVIGDYEAKEMRESEVDKKAETIGQNGTVAEVSACGKGKRKRILTLQHNFEICNMVLSGYTG